METEAVVEVLPEPPVVVPPPLVVVPVDPLLEVLPWVAPVDPPLDGCVVPDAVLVVELSVPVPLHPLGVLEDEGVELLVLVDEEPVELLASVDEVVGVLAAHELDPAVEAVSVPVVDPVVAPPEMGPMLAPPPVFEPAVLCSLCLTVPAGEPLETVGAFRGGATVASVTEAGSAESETRGELVAESFSDAPAPLP